MNDCSRDQSWTVIQELKQQHPDTITGISLFKNAGQHKALLCGFRFARGEWVVTLDDDMQFAPEDILTLHSHQQKTQADLVYGMPAVKKHSALRNRGSRVLAWIFERYAAMPGRGSSFKLVRGSIIGQIRDFNHPYTFVDELICWYASNIQYATVDHHEQNNSNYSLFQLLKLGINIVLAYTVLPLRFMIWFGFLSFMVCLGFVAYFVYMKLVYGAQLGFTALIVSVLMSTGLILCCLGILGEYMNRLFAMQSRKPAFLIREII